jgi:DNA-binding transcriptional LysR family regulator
MGASTDEIVSMISFARVVEARSFTAAAARLAVSKSVVSARVAALEAQLGVRLLHRTTRKLSLTPDGLALYERCLPMVSAADDAAAALAGTGDRPRGLLRVNAPIVFAQEYLTEPIAAFLTTFPEVRVDIGLSDKLVDLVDEGIDVAVRVTMKLQGAGLVARKLASDHTALVASPAYLARRGTPTSADDLIHHDCLVYSLLKSAQEWHFRQRGSKESVGIAVEPRLSAASGALLRRAALSGIGLAVLPNFMVAADLATGRLRNVIDSFRGVTLGIHAVYPEAGRPPAKVRAFVDHLVTWFRTPRW